jgi:hypothetical protein
VIGTPVVCLPLPGRAGRQVNVWDFLAISSLFSGSEITGRLQIELFQNSIFFLRPGQGLEGKLAN